MRYVQLHVTPTDGTAFHPIGERIMAADDLEGKAIHRLDDLGDGTVTLLARASGNPDRYREILSSSPAVYEFTVAADDDNEGAWGYSRVETNDLVEYMLERDRKLDLMRDGPIELTEDGGQRVTLIGTTEAFMRAREYDEPDGYDVEVEKMGEYHPESGRLVDALTDRQLEILETAVETGYYDQPRRATHEDIADRVDCAPATVGEHLQKVERAVLGSLVG